MAASPARTASYRAHLASRTKSRRAGFLDARQIHAERGAVADAAVDLDETAALLDDAVNCRQSQARALAQRLGAEERLKDARLRRLVHAGAGIGDRQHD